jgi:hypothetical protein
MTNAEAIQTLKLIQAQVEWEYPMDYAAAIDEAIKALEAQEWIPVSERLPESKPEDLEYPTVIACCEDGEVMTACYYESTKEWGIGENYDRKINPVAWMPLPEPYRAERRTE